MLKGKNACKYCSESGPNKRGAGSRGSLYVNTWLGRSLSQCCLKETPATTCCIILLTAVP